MPDELCRATLRRPIAGDFHPVLILEENRDQSPVIRATHGNREAPSGTGSHVLRVLPDEVVEVGDRPLTDPTYFEVVGGPYEKRAFRAHEQGAEFIGGLNDVAQRRLEDRLLAYKVLGWDDYDS